MSTRKKNYCMPDHDKYLSRIKKSLYYTNLPKNQRLSLPVTEFAAEVFSEHKSSFEKLKVTNAAKISKSACVSPCSLILALVYLERLRKNNLDYVSSINSSDLFLVSLMVSSKYLYDDGETDEVFMEEWADAGEMTVSQLVLLERQFLQAINWEIYIDQSVFWKKLNYLEQHLAKKNGSSRGYFTYTELLNASNDTQIYSLIYCVASITAILAATYVIGLVTLAGSFYLSSCVPGSALYQNNEINLRLHSNDSDFNDNYGQTKWELLNDVNLYSNENGTEDNNSNINIEFDINLLRRNYKNDVFRLKNVIIIQNLVVIEKKLNSFCTLVPNSINLNNYTI